MILFYFFFQILHMSQTFIFTFFLGGCGQCLSWSGQIISHIFPWESHKKSPCSPQRVNHFHSYFTAASGPYPSLLFYMFHHTLKSTVQTCRHGILTVHIDTVYPPVPTGTKKRNPAALYSPALWVRLPSLFSSLKLSFLVCEKKGLSYVSDIQILPDRVWR